MEAAAPVSMIRHAGLQVGLEPNGHVQKKNEKGNSYPREDGEGRVVAKGCATQGGDVVHVCMYGQVAVAPGESAVHGAGEVRGDGWGGSFDRQDMGASWEQTSSNVFSDHIKT